MTKSSKHILLSSICILPWVIAIVLSWYQSTHNDTKDYNYEIYRSKIELKYYASKDAIIEAIDDYIDSIAPNSCLNGIALFEACEEYNIDIKFALAQGQLESHFGTFGIASKTNSVWNVLAYDGKTADEMIKNNQHYSHPDESIKPYLELLAKDYLVKGKTEMDLMANFTNKFGKRYASSKTYENQLINIYKYINSSTTIQYKYDIYKHYKILSGK